MIIEQALDFRVHVGDFPGNTEKTLLDNCTKVPRPACFIKLTLERPGLGVCVCVGGGG